MKRTIAYLLAAVAVVAMSGSCEREKFAPEQEGFTITASINGEETRVEYDYTTDPTQVVPTWAEGDKIFGWDDLGRQFTFTVTSVTEGVASLNVGGYDPEKAKVLYAIYYPGKGVENIKLDEDERSVDVDLSAQNGSLTSGSPVLMCATAGIVGNTASLKFDNMTAIVGVTKFKVGADVTVDGFSINGVKTAGVFEVVNGTLTLTPSEEVSSITASGLSLKADAEGVVDPGLWFAVLPTENADMSLDVTSDGGAYANVTAVPTTTLAVGNYYYMANVMSTVAASVDGEKYSTFEAALAAANSAEAPCTLKLLESVQQDAVEFTNTNLITFDLNGKTLTAPVTLAEGAKCRILGKGTMKLPSTTGCLIKTDGSSELTIENGTFTGPTSSNDNYSCIRANGASGKTATLTINGGTFTCKSQAGIIRSFYSNVTVNDATMTASSDYGRVFLTSTAGVITVNNGVFTAGNACVASWVAGGEIYINGGKFKSTHASRGVFYIYKNANTLAVSGGYFTSTKADVITFASSQTISNISITGGKFHQDASANLPADTGYKWNRMASPDNSTISGCELTYEVIPNDIAAGTTVYGFVKSAGIPLPGVVVTDGYEFTQTDSNGRYELQSDKEYGFVEISIPSGYRAQSSGVIPQFFARMEKEPGIVERHDFNLVEDADQTRHTMLFFTDPHLAKEYNDIATFRIFEDDVNDYITSHPSENIFAATGGDMSFDKKWYRHNYLPANYVAEENNAFSANHLQIFHCIGNHDHELGKDGAYPAGEVACAQKYKDAFGPTYYSYNIGQVHYVCLDNIYCTNDGTGTASYRDSIDACIMEWLAKDLSYVDVSTPVFIQMHAPLFNAAGNRSLDNADALIAALSGRTTYILSGHSHRLYTIDKMSELGIIEMNNGSICGTWWVTSYYSPGIRINREGTPAGYRIIKVNGKNVTWQYKAYGRDMSEQFRTYDLNSIYITPQKYSPDMSEDKLSDFNTCMWKFTTDWRNNRFFILVYDYDPLWTVSVTENGNPLSVSSYNMYDPLHMIAYEAKIFNKDKTPTSSLRAQYCYHSFLVTPTSGTSTLEVTVTDRFGNQYRKSVTRPQPFSIKEYAD